MTSNDKDLYDMFAEYDSFDQFVSLMDDRDTIIKQKKCPYCGNTTLVAISIEEAECETCLAIINI